MTRPGRSSGATDSPSWQRWKEETGHAIHPLLLARMESWGNPDPGPPARVLDILTDVLHVGEPWFQVLLIYVLDQGPRRWKNTAQQLALVRSGWQSAWREQGHPTLDRLSLIGLSGERNSLSVRVGRAVVRAMKLGGGLQHNLIGPAKALLPGRYIPPLGWQNLPLSSEVHEFLAYRSGIRTGSVPDHYLGLAELLHHYREKPWVSALVCIAGAMLNEVGSRGRGERNGIPTIRNTVKGVGQILEHVWPAQGLVSVRDLRTGRDLPAYLKGTYGGPDQPTRKLHTGLYLAAVGSQGRLDAGTRARMTPWLLPEVSESTVDKLNAVGAEPSKREPLVEALRPHHLRVLHVIARRSEMFRDLSREAQKATVAFMQQATSDAPVGFEVPLRDGSATLRFRIISVKQLDQETRKPSARRRARPALENKVVTEFLGAHDASGQRLDDPFFVVVQRGWYDEATRTKLVQTGLGQWSDYTTMRSGYLRAPVRVGQFCGQQIRAALKDGRRVPVLFDADALCAGAAVGALVGILGMATAIRIHEMQQLQVPRVKIDPNKPYTRPTHDRCLECSFQRKGEKRGSAREGMTIHLLPAEVTPYWDEYMRMHRRLWPEISWRWSRPQSGAELRLDVGIPLFQGAGRPLRQTDLNRMLRFMTWGADTDVPNMTTHLLRYSYVHLRTEMGQTLETIRDKLGHHHSDITRTYKGKAVEGRGAHLDRQTGTVWQALQSIIVHRTADKIAN